MPNPGVGLGDSEDIIIVGMGSPSKAKRQTVDLPDGSTVSIDPVADAVEAIVNPVTDGN